MGSLVMHCCVGEILKKSYKFSERFTLGTLKPDILKLNGGDRDKTHYIKRIIEEQGVKNLPDILEFIQKNKENIKDEEQLGYLCHLIEDRIWFDDYVGKYTRTDANDIDKVVYIQNGNVIKSMKEFSADMYKDYANINKFLIEKYKIDIDEIKKLIANYIGEKNFNEKVEKNFAVNDADIGKENTFITKEDLEMYINDCARKATVEIDRILKG